MQTLTLRPVLKSNSSSSLCMGCQIWISISAQSWGLKLGASLALVPSTGELR